MKRRFAWLLAVLLMLALLCACAETKTASTEPYTVGSYTVTPINEKSGTITDGTNTYSYRYSTSGSGYSVTFSYPDGESYTWTENGSSAVRRGARMEPRKRRAGADRGGHFDHCVKNGACL